VHPAFSVIFFTTLIGAGQGLFLAIFSAELASFFGGFPMQDDAAFYASGSLVCVMLLAAGLAASFLHLGRPERAWQAVRMWRTSWLSREVIVLPATMVAILVYGLAHYTGWHRDAPGWTGAATLIAGSLAAILCLALFVCTAMIYVCIRFLQEWASPLTIINYVLLGSASGFMLASAFAAYTAERLVIPYGIAALILTAAALVTRGASLIRNANLRPKSMLQTATGIKHPVIAQKSKGFMAGSFNTREFFHGKTKAFLRAVKWIFLVLVFPVPMLLLTIGLFAAPALWLPLAFAVQYTGLIAERWYFFAEANHPQNLYYQAIA
jgi:DMSO reductase anchor subunit